MTVLVAFFSLVALIASASQATILCRPAKLNDLTLDDGQTRAVIIGPPSIMATDKLGTRSKAVYHGAIDDVKFIAKAYGNGTMIEVHSIGASMNSGTGYLYEVVVLSSEPKSIRATHKYFNARQDDTICRLLFEEDQKPDMFKVHRLVWRD